MAPRGNSNRTQKNGVRYALATAATVMTLLGAQSLAFAGKANSSIQVQATQTVVALAPTTETVTQLAADTASPTTVPANNVVATATATTVKATTVSQVTLAATQPTPSSKSSR